MKMLNDLMMLVAMFFCVCFITNNPIDSFASEMGASQITMSQLRFGPAPSMRSTQRADCVARKFVKALEDAFEEGDSEKTIIMKNISNLIFVKTGELAVAFDQHPEEKYEKRIVNSWCKHIIELAMKNAYGNGMAQVLAANDNPFGVNESSINHYYGDSSKTGSGHLN